MKHIVRDLIAECRQRGGCLRKDNGAWQINRTPWERVNVYTKLGDTPPHSHAHSFTSHVVHGWMLNERFKEAPDPNGYYRYSVDRSDGDVVFVPIEGRAGLKKVGEDYLSPSVIYYMPRAVIHIASVKEPSITYIIRTEHEPAPQRVYALEPFEESELRRLVKPGTEDWSEIDPLLKEAGLL